MPSSYTTNNGIEKIGSGEQAGVWDTTTNLNFDLIDTSLDGQVTVTLASAGDSGSPNTLAISDGAASDGRNRYVEFDDGGDLGATAYVQLTPNDAEKLMIVKNSLSASRSIILFQGTYNSSNDYELSNGDTVLLKFDGAGSGAVVTKVPIESDLGPADNVDINGGAIDGTTVGASSASSGAFTTLNASGATTLDGDVTLGNATGDTITATGRFGSSLVPDTDDTYDLGTASLQWQDAWFDGTLTTDILTVDSTSTFAGTASFNGDVNLGNATSDTITATGRFDSDLVPSTNAARDLGTSGLQWQDLWVTGTGNIDTLQLASGTSITEFSTDENLSGNSDNAVPTEQAVKAYVDASGLDEYTSSGQTVTSGGSVTLSHGLGGEPKFIAAFLQVTSSNNGYSTGDRIYINPGLNYPSQSGGMTMEVTSTQIIIRYGSRSSVFQVIDQGDSSSDDVSNGSVDLYIKAYR